MISESICNLRITGRIRRALTAEDAEYAERTKDWSVGTDAVVSLGMLGGLCGKTILIGDRLL